MTVTVEDLFGDQDVDQEPYTIEPGELEELDWSDIQEEYHPQQQIFQEDPNWLDDLAGLIEE